jgi:predicted metal-dependent hydrolase
MSEAALHPDLAPEERRRLLLEGIALFNSARFFEAHEAWEEVWRSTTPEPKELLQGLIQVAVAMVHHLDRGRPAVARRVLAKARRRIAPHRPLALGIDLDALLASIDRWDRWLGRDDGAPPPALPAVTIARRADLR